MGAVGNPPQCPQTSPCQLPAPSAVADAAAREERPTSQFEDSLPRSVEDAQVDTLFPIEPFEDTSADRPDLIEVECEEQDDCSTALDWPAHQVQDIPMTVESPLVSDSDCMDMDERSYNGTTEIHLLDDGANSDSRTSPISPPSSLNTTSSDSPSPSNSTSPIYECPGGDRLTEGWIRHLRRNESARSEKSSQAFSWIGLAALAALTSPALATEEEDDEMDHHGEDSPILPSPDETVKRSSDQNVEVCFQT